MIIEWSLSFFLTWLFPQVLSLFNPFFLPISSYVLKRKSLIAANGAYFQGIMRDILLATPRFGMLGMSSLFASLIAIAITFHFSLEGLLGSLVITIVLTLCDIFFAAFLGSFLYGRLFFSWKALFFAILFSFIWTFSIKSVPKLIRFFLLRRRRRCDADS